jgi:hypothetical protein
MGAAQFTILLLVALFNIQHLHAGIPADFCSRRSDGNYLCPPSDASDAKTGTVCGCRERESCDDGAWFDPAEDACCTSKDFLRKLIRCMNDGKDEFINPTDLPVPDATFCSQKADGNYPCDPDSSLDICSCFYGRKCGDGEWYDLKNPLECSTLTNDVLAKLTTCFGLPADTTPIQPEITMITEAEP